MPRLVNSFLRVQFSEKKARGLLSEKFKERGWESPEVRELKLLFVPRYYFEYSIVNEESDENKKFVSDFCIEKGYFDPIAKELIVEQLSESDLTNEFNESVEFSVLHPTIKRSDAKKIASVLLSKERRVARDSIEFLHFNLYFVPVWCFVVEAEKKKFEIEINAFTGRVKELTPIPVKQRPWSQVLNETISDLKKPRNWLVYSGQILFSFFGIVKRIIAHRYVKGFFRALWKNRDLQLAILLIILFVLLYIAFVG